jgi:hypothetical protein
MAEALLPALERARDLLAALRLDLPLPSAVAARRARDDLGAQIDDYLLPRLRNLDAPLLMVVGGSTGAGKSTLVNSIVGAVVSPAGVLRPTTRAPVLACNPDDVTWFADDRVLPSFPRTTGGPAGPGGLELVPTENVPAGLALLDSPDIDSVLKENRELARQLLSAADAWLFVTTAARYADAVPWEFLRAARERATSLAVVLNRVPPDAFDVVPAHLREMLATNGLPDADVFVVPETQLDGELLPRQAFAPLASWLDALSGDARTRAATIRRTLEGALASVPRRMDDVARDAREQLDGAAWLVDAAESSYAAALEEVEASLANGSLLRGEVLARWQDFVGTGKLTRALEARVGALRDRLRSAITGRPPADEELSAALESSVEAVVRAAADRAAERTARSWQGDPAGKGLVGDVPRADASSTTFPAATEEQVRAWQEFVFDLVRAEGAGKRSSARLASFGVNGAGLVVMLAVFAHTGGLTGAEAVVAGGTSAVAQKVLEAIFGDQAVRELAARARADLLERVGALLAAEAERYRGVVEPLVPSRAEVDALDAAARTVEAAR